MHSKVPINNVPRKPSSFKFKVDGFVSRSTQRELLRKKPKNNNKVWLKLSEAILSILRDYWRKILFLFSLPARLIEVSSKQARWTYTLRPDLLEIFPADITDQFGCGQRAEFTLSVGGKGEEASNK